MKQITIKTISVVSIISMFLSTIVYAHGGNITGYKDKESDKITKKDGEYYGYHKEDKEIHYHKVEWKEEKQRWQIKNSSIYYDENLKMTKNPNLETEKVEVKLSTVVDGDTAKFKLEDEIITVRFLAVDTPETKHPDKGVEPYGPEASAFTKEKLMNAKKIVLEYDGNSTKMDKYNRHLAWIWIDNQLLQELLIDNGLARVEYIYGDYKYVEKLREKEKIAKENKVGLWKDEQKDTFIEQISDTNNETQEHIKKDEISIIVYVGMGIIILVIVAICRRSKK